MKTCVTHHRCDCTQARIDTLEKRLQEATALLERAKTDVECMRTRYKEEEDRISCAVWLADLEKFNKENGK